VDCRIQVLDEHGVRTVSVAGRLGNAHIPDLLMACGEISASLHVDLTDMVSADAVAVDALRRMREGGALLAGVPTYIQLTLDSPARRGEW
jgi:hypothetical protein